jgi:hypothetical protein
MHIQQTDMADQTCAAAAIAQIQLLLELFDAHAYHEDSFILSEVEKRNASFADEFEEEHVEDLRLTTSLRNKVSIYEAAEPGVNAFIAGNELYYALNDFVAFNLKHMNKEEKQLNEFLWANFTDEQIIDMEIRLQQAIPSERLFTYFIWMIRGINDSELKMWLTAVRNGAPDFIFQGLLAECKNQLSEQRWMKLEGQLVDCSPAN